MTDLIMHAYSDDSEVIDLYIEIIDGYDYVIDRYGYRGAIYTGAPDIPMSLSESCIQARVSDYVDRCFLGEEE